MLDHLRTDHRRSDLCAHASDFRCAGSRLVQDSGGNRTPTWTQRIFRRWRETRNPGWLQGKHHQHIAFMHSSHEADQSAGREIFHHFETQAQPINPERYEALWHINLQAPQSTHWLCPELCMLKSTTAAADSRSIPLKPENFLVSQHCLF